MNFTEQISFLDWIILSLSVFRLTRLLIFDEICHGLRTIFLTIHHDQHGAEDANEYVSIKGTGIRYVIGYLFTCHWCMGIWVAAFVTTLYFVVPIVMPFFIGLSIAGVSSIIHSLLSIEKR